MACLYRSKKGSCRKRAPDVDTLDYARYGIKQSLLVLAQKAAVDVLDKVAAAANVDLKIGGDPQAVSFGTCWHERDDAKKGKTTCDAPQVAESG